MEHTTPNADEVMEKQELSFIAGMSAKWYQHFGRHSGSFLQNLLPYDYHMITLLPYDPAITLLGSYPKELKSFIPTINCTWMFITALFIITEIWKQPRCTLVDELINKLWYLQTIEYYLAVKNELKIHEKT